MVMVVMLMLLLIMVMVVMLMLLLIMVMVMMFVLFPIVVMVMVMVMAGALRIVTLILVVVPVGGLGLGHQFLGQRMVSHGGQDHIAGDLIPGSGDDGGIGVVLLQKLHHFVQLLLGHVLRAGEDNGAGGLDLVVEELTEVLHIHLALLGVDDGDGAAQHHGGGLVGVAHGAAHVAQLAHAGGLNDDAVGVILLHHIVEGFVKVAHQRAADAAGVHLVDLDAGILEKAAVDADLAEFVFNQHQLLALKGLLKQLLDEGGLARAEEAGNNVDSGHNNYLFV